MKVVITGSTQGIGLGMAREFLKRGHDVLISSRRAAAVEAVVTELRQEFPGRQVAGQPCDVGEYADVEALWTAALTELGQVDIWVNNAGRDGVKAPFFAVPPEDFALTVKTNLLGVMNCCRVAIPGMYAQGGGRIFNMEGFGSNGQVRPAVAPYGTTKYGLVYLTKALALELKNTPVKMCYLSPGIVVTDLLVPPPDQRGERWEQSKKILNILADTVETVTPYLVEGILKTDKNGGAVRWLTRGKVRWRFLMSLFRKRDVFGPLGY